ncbi:MAG: hypothetical protein H6544_01685 [Prevotellaceae bacterium]|nr:hypothetical protein [Prevotellaceae bacterium]
MLSACPNGRNTSTRAKATTRQEGLLINIVCFSWQEDTIYGKTVVAYDGDILELSPFQRQTFKVDKVSQLYPEYYILKVNDFNRMAKSPLEEWIYYLNTGDIPNTATAPGLTEARERLKLDKMTKSELEAYYRHLDNVVILRDNIYTERAEGIAEGHAEGLAEGIEKGIIEEKLRNAKTMKEMGLSADTISKITGLSIKEIETFNR